jgi:alpha-L-fucosidase
MTTNGNTIYLHVRDVPRFPIEFREIGGKVKGVRLLKTGKKLPYKVREIRGFWGGQFRDLRANRIWIELAAEDCDDWNTAVAIDFESEPIWP